MAKISHAQAKKNIKKIAPGISDAKASKAAAKFVRKQRGGKGK